MTEPQRYTVAQAPSIESLELFVEACLEAGFRPIGGLVIQNSELGTVYMQTLYRDVAD